MAAWGCSPVLRAASGGRTLKLTLGEPQHRGFRRLLLNPAHFVMLVEVMSTVDLPTEARLDATRRRHGCVDISVTRRPAAVHALPLGESAP